MIQSFILAVTGGALLLIAIWAAFGTGLETEKAMRSNPHRRIPNEKRRTVVFWSGTAMFALLMGYLILLVR